MATQIEKLETEQLEKLKEFQAKSNDIIISLGQISVRTRDLNLEIKRLENNIELHWIRCIRTASWKNASRLFVCLFVCLFTNSFAFHF